MIGRDCSVGCELLYPLCAVILHTLRLSARVLLCISRKFTAQLCLLYNGIYFADDADAATMWTRRSQSHCPHVGRTVALPLQLALPRCCCCCFPPLPLLFFMQNSTTIIAHPSPIGIRLPPPLSLFLFPLCGSLRRTLLLPSLHLAAAATTTTTSPPYSKVISIKINTTH